MTYIPSPGAVPQKRPNAQLFFPFGPLSDKPKPLANVSARPLKTSEAERIALNLHRLETDKKYSIAVVRQMYAKHLAELGHSASYDELHWTFKSKAENADLDTVYSEMAKVLDDFKRK